MVHIASLTDRVLKQRAKAGDKEAQEEMIRRGLAYDPQKVAEARAVSKRPWIERGWRNR